MLSNTPQVSFNGKLTEAVTSKNTQLLVKTAFAKSVKVAEEIAAEEQKFFKSQADGFYASSAEKTRVGNEQFKTRKADAKQRLSGDKTLAKSLFRVASQSASDVLTNARQETKKLFESMNSVAKELDRLKAEDKKSLKEIQVAGKSLSKMDAASKPVKEVGSKTKEVQEAMTSVSESLKAAQEKIAKLEAEEKAAIAEKAQKAKLKKAEAKERRSERNSAQNRQYRERMKSLREQKAEALEASAKLYKSSMNVFKETLKEYKAQAGFDEKIAKELEQHIAKAEDKVLGIKVLSVVARPKNLNNIAKNLVEMGEIGGAATGSFVNRVIRTLTHHDFVAGVEGKKSAVNAASTLITDGSLHQSNAMLAGLDLHADKIVNRTNNAEVLEKLVALDKTSDEQKMKNTAQMLVEAIFNGVIK